jgi:hypothetical protein
MQPSIQRLQVYHSICHYYAASYPHRVFDLFGGRRSSQDHVRGDYSQNATEPGLEVDAVRPLISRRFLNSIYYLWAAFVSLQSIDYYVYLESGKQALAHSSFDQAETLFRMAIAEVENSASYHLVGERDIRHRKALQLLATAYRKVRKERQARAVDAEVREVGS